MKAILPNASASITELKRNPGAIIEIAREETVTIKKDCLHPEVWRMLDKCLNLRNVAE